MPDGILARPTRNNALEAASMGDVSSGRAQQSSTWTWYRPFRVRPILADQLERTALRESAYQRRTRYRVGDLIHDFTVRQGDLVAARLLVPPSAPEWALVPWKCWSRSDEVVAWIKAASAVRAWYAVANLPDATPGHWLDTVETFVRETLVAQGAVVEVVLHEPLDKPPHAHLLIAARELGRSTFGQYRPEWHDAIVDELQPRWLRWLGQGA